MDVPSGTHGAWRSASLSAAVSVGAGSSGADDAPGMGFRKPARCLFEPSCDDDVFNATVCEIVPHLFDV